MKKLLTILLVLVFLIGIVMVAYPVVSVHYNEKHQSAVYTQYRKEILETEADTLRIQREMAIQYNRQLSTGLSFHKSEIPKYEALLNVGGDGIMGYISIPSIGMTLPIYHGTGESVLQKGAGHMVGTSLPVGGIGTHTVISAHTGMASNRMFTDLLLVQEGDFFVLHVLGEELYYEVDQILTVLPTQASALKIDPGKDYATLVTCTPYGVNSHRLLVRGHRVRPVEQSVVEQEAQNAVTYREQSLWEEEYLNGIRLGVAISVILVISIGFFVWFRKKRTRQ